MTKSGAKSLGEEIITLANTVEDSMRDIHQRITSSGEELNPRDLKPLMELFFAQDATFSLIYFLLTKLQKRLDAGSKRLTLTGGNLSTSSKGKLKKYSPVWMDQKFIKIGKSFPTL